jgi:glycosyltransferase 2 family protein
VNAPQKIWLRRLITTAKILVFAILCGFIYHTFTTANKSLGEHTWHVEPQWLLLSGLLYLLGLFPAAVFWQRVLLKAGQRVNLGEALRAYYISQLGKYVPGKWMVIVLRSTLIHAPSLENTVVAASVFFETFTVMAVGSAVSLVMLLAAHRDQPLLIAMAVGSALLMGVPTIPVVFQWLMHVLRVGKINPTAGAKFSRIGFPTILVGWLTIGIGCLVQGAAFWATLRGLDATTDGPLADLTLHTTAVALGIVAGFISQIPGGLGMREWVSATLVEPHYGPTVAIVSAIIFRIVLLVSELLASIILYGVGWRRLRKDVAVIEAELTASGNS